MRRSSRRRPSSAAPSTSGTLDRVAAILARRIRGHAAGRLPRWSPEGPLFDSEAFSSHNARVKAWQPKAHALRKGDIRKRKRRFSRPKKATGAITAYCQGHCTRPRNRSSSVHGPRPREKLPTKRQRKKAQQQLALQMVERKRARCPVSRKESVRRDMSKATPEELSTTANSSNEPAKSHST